MWDLSIFEFFLIEGSLGTNAPWKLREDCILIHVLGFIEIKARGEGEEVETKFWNSDFPNYRIVHNLVGTDTA